MVVLAIVLIGFLWSFLFLLPFYAFVGVAGLLVWQSRQKEADISASVAREAERQRLFNRQEMQAWQTSLQKQQTNSAKRERMLRRLDSAHVPPKKPDS